MKNKDLLSHIIEVGDYVAHATQRGDSAMLKISKVLGFATKKDYRGRIEEKIIVWGVEPWTSGFALNRTKGFITENQRLVVLDKSRIPEKILRLLEPVDLNFKPKKCTVKVKWSNEHGSGEYTCGILQCEEHNG